MSDEWQRLVAACVRRESEHPPPVALTRPFDSSCAPAKRSAGYRFSSFAIATGRSNMVGQTFRPFAMDASGCREVRREEICLRLEAAG
jgi:hypothetical protein